MTLTQTLFLATALILISAIAGRKTNQDAAKLWPITYGWRLFTYGFFAAIGLAGALTFKKFGLFAGFLLCIPTALLASLGYTSLCVWYHRDTAK